MIWIVRLWGLATVQALLSNLEFWWIVPPSDLFTWAYRFLSTIPLGIIVFLWVYGEWQYKRDCSP